MDNSTYITSTIQCTLGKAGFAMRIMLEIFGECV